MGIMRRILITGGLGFQGSNLTKRLLQRGFEVNILNTYSKFAEEKISKLGLEKANVIWGSITDKQVLDKAVRDVDVVFHAAANVHVDLSISYPTRFYEVNVLGTNNVLEFCRERDIPLVHVSTCETLGFQEGILNEKSPLRPNSPYASSKASAEVMCYSYYKTYDMQINILRPSNVYGPGQKNGLNGAVIPRFVEKALNNYPISVYGDGKQSREFTFIDDLVDAYELIIEKTLWNKDFKGNIYNIGSGEAVTIIELASMIINLSKSKSNIENLKPRLGEVQKFQLDSSLFKENFIWEAQHNLTQGLNKYINWVIDGQ